MRAKPGQGQRKGSRRRRPPSWLRALLRGYLYFAPACRAWLRASCFALAVHAAAACHRHVCGFASRLRASRLHAFCGFAPWRSAPSRLRASRLRAFTLCAFALSRLRAFALRAFAPSRLRASRACAFAHMGGGPLDGPLCSVVNINVSARACLRCQWRGRRRQSEVGCCVVINMLCMSQLGE